MCINVAHPSLQPAFWWNHSMTLSQIDKKKQLTIVRSTNSFHLPKRNWHFLYFDASISTPISVKSSTCLHTVAPRDENLSPHYCFHYARCCPPGKVVALQEGNFYLCGKKNKFISSQRLKKCLLDDECLQNSYSFFCECLKILMFSCEADGDEQLTAECKQSISQRAVRGWSLSCEWAEKVWLSWQGRAAQSD